MEPWMEPEPSVPRLPGDLMSSDEEEPEQSIVGDNSKRNTKDGDMSEMDGTMEQRPVPKSDKSDNSDNSDNSDYSDNEECDLSVFKTGDCRICYQSEEESDKGPIIQLGCQCKDDISYGHELCLKNWFVRRLLKDEILNCELCRWPLGAHLEAIVKNEHPEVMAPRAHGLPQVLLLVQLPPKDLDDLEVPHDTPPFESLSHDTRIALEDAFRRQEQVHRNGETRRAQNFMDLLDENGEGPRLTAEQEHARFDRLADLLHQFIGVVNVITYTAGLQSDPPQPVVRAFIPSDEARALLDGDTDPNDVDIVDFTVFLEGPRAEVIRVAVEEEVAAADPNLEDLLDELAMHVNVLPSLVLLPRSMRIQGTPSDDRQYIPVPYNNSAGAGPLALEPAHAPDTLAPLPATPETPAPGPATRPAPAPATSGGREFTYARFRRFLLCDIY